MGKPNDPPIEYTNRVQRLGPGSELTITVAPSHGPNSIYGLSKVTDIVFGITELDQMPVSGPPLEFSRGEPEALAARFVVGEAVCYRDRQQSGAAYRALGILVDLVITKEEPPIQPNKR